MRGIMVLADLPAVWGDLESLVKVGSELSLRFDRVETRLALIELF